MGEVRDRDAVQLAGLRVDVTNSDQLVDQIMSWAEGMGPARTAVGVNAHVCNLAARNPFFRLAVLNADLAYADGQSVVWASRLLGVAMPERVATTDMVFPLAAACAQSGKRVFFYGGAPGVAEAAATRLQSLYPGLNIATNHGYIPDEEMPKVIARINGFGTDLLFVGLGDPLQQTWVSDHRDRLRVRAILTCGGLFDWTSGVHRRPPHWMVAAGFEWLWRVLLEPRRLAQRYLVGNPVFVARVSRQFVRERLGRSDRAVG